ncbi:Ferredoxin C 2, chloroplastic [Turnera subulata]|uniref:Ferredoxin C 2, chloroplastic n=1 Tax=Turnera subulata TaxID=218843 RepID=A0A9Q0GD37_9ROSI|nr:Ferredoxin C 2, chloroplastic [Turnera subulata]
MDLITSCSSTTSSSSSASLHLHRRPPALHRKTPFAPPPSTSLKPRLPKTTANLQSSAATSASTANGNISTPSIPTHKVTVRDRQRGVVHEFLVPEINQPEALGISAELKSKGYALLCVGFPSSDVEVETQDEDEVYWLQFGRYFARGPIERDDYALELALADE